MEENKKRYSVAIVLPAHIELSKEFVKSLKSVAKNHTVIVVDDSDGKVEYPDEWDVYDYSRQREELGDELYSKFEKFHKSSACRNFGHWIAYRKGFDIIIGLDSDCIVPPDFVSKHIEALMKNGYGWVNPIENTNWFPRGFPYHERARQIVLNVGLWENELDVNGSDRVRGGNPPKDPGVNKQELAHGIIPLCGMNFSCWAWMIPAFLFLPNFDDGEEKFRRYDDIWGGYIFQKLMQKRKEKISYGFPIVYHDTVIDAMSDAKLEEAGIRWEEKFYQLIDMICEKIDASDYPSMFKNFAQEAKLLEDTPFQSLIESFEWWVNVFKK